MRELGRSDNGHLDGDHMKQANPGAPGESGVASVWDRQQGSFAEVPPVSPGEPQTDDVSIEGPARSADGTNRNRSAPPEQTVVTTRRTGASRRLIAGVGAVSVLAIALALTGLILPGWGVHQSTDSSDSVAVPSPAGGSSQPVAKVACTTTWVNFYGVESTVDLQTIPVGSVITAYDPQGVLCGEYTVTQAGRYGLMPVYGDNPLTGTDEGASVGDRVSFYVDGVAAQTIGPDEPVWSAMGDLHHVELMATAAP